MGAGLFLSLSGAEIGKYILTKTEVPDLKLMQQLFDLVTHN